MAARSAAYQSAQARTESWSRVGRAPCRGRLSMRPTRVACSIVGTGRPVRLDASAHDIYCVTAPSPRELAYAHLARDDPNTTADLTTAACGAVVHAMNPRQAWWAMDDEASPTCAPASPDRLRLRCMRRPAPAHNDADRGRRRLGRLLEPEVVHSRRRVDPRDADLVAGSAAGPGENDASRQATPAGRASSSPARPRRGRRTATAPVGRYPAK